MNLYTSVKCIDATSQTHTHTYQHRPQRQYHSMFQSANTRNPVQDLITSRYPDATYFIYHEDALRRGSVSRETPLKRFLHSLKVNSI